MSFSHDRRGQSVVVGTVILFGFLILALSLYQVQFVPAENSEIEFEHSQEVEGDFLDLRNDVLSTGTTGSARSTSIRLGTRYPQRTFFLNPPAASGTLQTTDERPIRIENSQLGDGAHPNARAFWNTTPQFNTTSIQYRPDYNEYRGAPRLTYEHSLVAAEFENSVLPRSGQTIVRDGRISLAALTGSISENGVEARSIDTDTVSQQQRTVPITGANGENFEIRLPSAVGDVQDLVNRTTIRDAEDVTAEGDDIVITLNGSKTYRLGLSEVSVDGTGSMEPAYIVPVGGTGVPSEQRVGVEVRDKYNNPVEGAEVMISDGDDRTTGDDGRVFFNPGSNNSTASINQGTEVYEEVTFVTELGTGETEDGTGDVNPATRLGVRFDRASSETNDYALEFTNTGDNSVEIIQFRMNFYQIGSPGRGGGGQDRPTSGLLFNSEGDEIANFDIRGSAVDIEGEGVELPPGEGDQEGEQIEALSIEFEDGDIDPQRDWFIVTLRFSDGEEQRSAQYFVAV